MPVSVQISDSGLIRFLEHSFPSKAFDTVGIIVDNDGLGLFSMDRSKTMLGRLSVPASALGDYDTSERHVISVISESLSRALSIPTPSDTQDPVIILRWEFSPRQVTVFSEIGSRYHIRRSLRDIPTGIHRLPRLPDFSKAARCTLTDIHVLRHVSEVLSDFEDISLLIRNDELRFSPPGIGDPTDSFLVLQADTKGQAESTFSRSHFDIVTRVDQVAGVKDLALEVLDSGLGRFTFSYEGGSKLSYTLGSAIGG